MLAFQGDDAGHRRSAWPRSHATVAAGDGECSDEWMDQQKPTHLVSGASRQLSDLSGDPQRGALPEGGATLNAVFSYPSTATSRHRSVAHAEVAACGSSCASTEMDDVMTFREEWIERGSGRS